MGNIVEKINQLKKERNAVVLVHNYQPPEVQDIADFLGDSLDLSRTAASTDADVIIFCGVHFMAETAHILSPTKKVILPELKSGCPMADMADAEGVKKLKIKYPDAKVVTYVNSTAEVKAESDICCTSANAVDIVNSINTQKIIFTPDRNLGHYVSIKTGKEVILWNGYCPIHENILPAHIEEARQKYPSAKLLVHPECLPEIVKMADEVLSTTGMVRFVKKSKDKEFIIATETGIIYRMERENPDKKFYPASAGAVCVNMKKNSLEKVLWVLEDMKNEIKIDDDIRKKAKKCIDYMLENSK